MGDFLDDYLDGLGEGQRFNPLPYGPYYGTKDKRQWHLLADSEREQAIYEARMREEEESSSLDGGAGESGSSAGVVNQPSLDIDEAEPPVIEEESVIEYQDEQTTETFGTITNESGNVTYIEEELAASGSPGTQVKVTTLTHDDVILDQYVAVDPMNTSYGSEIYSLGMAYGTGVVWVTSLQPVNESYPGYFDIDTGVAKPMYAIGGNLAIVFRKMGDMANITHGVFGIFTTDTTPSDIQYVEYGEDSFDLNVTINVYQNTSDLIETIKQAYQQQTVKKWSYGIVEVTS
jgi:hypothetical protein